MDPAAITPHKTSKLEAVPPEILEGTLGNLPVRTMLKAMRVSRQIEAILLHILHAMLQTVIQKNLVKVLLTCDVPARANSRVICRYLRAYHNNAKATSMYSVFRPEARSPGASPNPVPVTVNDIFHREVSIEENEDFAQLRVILRLVLAASDFFVATPTVILENTTRLSRTWLGQGVPDILWLDDHKTVGLRLCPHEKQVPAPVAGATYYDIDVEEVHLLTTRFLVAVDEAQEAAMNENVVIFTPLS